MVWGCDYEFLRHFLPKMHFMDKSKVIVTQLRKKMYNIYCTFQDTLKVDMRNVDMTCNFICFMLKDLYSCIFNIIR